MWLGRGQYRGIILISALFFVLIISMVAAGTIMRGPAGLMMSDQAYRDLLARRAAEAGATYARSRLDENTSWQGDGNAMIVNSPDMQVIEDNGNVIGILKDVDGTVSQFRIRFNYQNGAGPAPLGNPASNHVIDNVYVSVNNLNSPNAAPVPITDPSNYQVSSLTGGISTPALSACIQVEGRVGSALQNLSNCDDPVPGGSSLHTKNLRIGMVRGAPLSQLNSAAMGADGVNITSPSGTNVSVVDAPLLPELRSKKGISVTKEGFSPANLYCPGILSRDPAVGVVGTQIGVKRLNSEVLGDGQDFLNLPWAVLPQPSNTTSVQLKGGVYVAWPDGSFHYYDQDLTTYRALAVVEKIYGVGGAPAKHTYTFSAPANEGQVLDSQFSQARGDSLTSGLIVEAAQLNIGPTPYFVSDSLLYTSVNITADVQVINSTSGVSGLWITDLNGRQMFAGDTSYVLPAANPYTVVDTNVKTGATSPLYQNYPIVTMVNSTVKANGDVVLLTDLIAQDSSVISGGNVVAASPLIQVSQSGSVSTTAPPQALSFYANQTLSLSTYTSQAQGNFYNNITLDGLLYSCGGINVYLGAPGMAGAANISLHGAMIGYGGDPSTKQPGSSGGGQVNLDCNQADLVLDFTKLGLSSFFNHGTTANLVRQFYGVNP